MDQKLQQAEKDLKRSIAAHFSIDMIPYYIEICRFISGTYTIIKQCIEFGTFDDNENKHNRHQQKLVQSSHVKIDAKIINQIKSMPDGILLFAIKDSHQWYTELNTQFEENADNEKGTQAYEDEKIAWLESGKRSARFLDSLVEDKHPNLIKALRKYCELRRTSVSN